MQGDTRTARIVSGWAAGLISAGVAFWLYGQLAVAVAAFVGGRVDLADALCQWIPAQVFGLIVGYPVGTGRRPRGLAAGALGIAIIVSVYVASQVMIDRVEAQWLSTVLTAIQLSFVVFLMFVLSFIWTSVFGWSDMSSSNPTRGDG